MEIGTRLHIEIFGGKATVTRIGAAAGIVYDLKNQFDVKAFVNATDLNAFGILSLIQLIADDPNAPVIKVLREAVNDVAAVSGINLQALPSLIISALANAPEKLEFDL